CLSTRRHPSPHSGCRGGRRTLQSGVRVMMTQVTIQERPGRLRRPVLLLAFAGWNDAAESATNAARFLRSAWDGQRIASLDPEEFYHFGLQRPLVRLVPGTLDREIVWPELEFMLC